MGTSPGNALITGASSGIGRDLARLFAKNGYRLVLIARRADRLKEFEASQAISADLSDPACVDSIARRLERPVDVLVNNAGLGTWGPFARTDGDVELKMMQVNMIALVQLTKLLLPPMLERRRGRILNVASTAAFQPGPMMAVYYATKAFVLSFSEALSEELRGSGVTVTALCPGPTETEFQSAAKMGRTPLKMMSSERVAKIGYDALMKGRRVAIPGVMNRSLARAAKFLPRGFVTRMVRRFQEPP